MKKLRLPGIYEFDESDSGYYSFRELLRAVNDRLDKIGNAPCTAQQLLKRFFIVTRKGYTNWTDGALVAWTLCALTDEGMLVTFSAEELDWYGHFESQAPPAIKLPKDVVLESLYFPAGWGKKILEYLDQGVERVVPMRAPTGISTFIVAEQAVKIK